MIPCFLAQGILPQLIGIAALYGVQTRLEVVFAIFPCNFPDNREIHAETCSLRTASTAINLIEEPAVPRPDTRKRTRAFYDRKPGIVKPPALSASLSADCCAGVRPTNGGRTFAQPGSSANWAMVALSAAIIG